jgi:transposase
MKNTTPIQSYDGEQIYVGIDVHKKSYVVVARVGQTIVKKWSTAAKPAELGRQLLKYFSGGIIHSIYEAGFSGFVLHRELVGQGIDNIVVHAAGVEVAAHNRVKTDKRDAANCAASVCPVWHKSNIGCSAAPGSNWWNIVRPSKLRFG